MQLHSAIAQPLGNMPVTAPQVSIGRSEIHRDRADADRFVRLAALLDQTAPSPWLAETLPPLGHWLCFKPAALQSDLGVDGHPQRTASSLLPDVARPRRMWAGSRVHFLSEIPLDAEIERQTTLMSAKPKSGRSGQMLFVTLRHEIGMPGHGPAIVEEQDIVYREAPARGERYVRRAEHPGPSDTLIRTVVPDATMMFRYSALTFNAHRIHYDREYTREAEGYPGLVVQGPLIATLMLDHFLSENPRAQISTFSFRATSPVFEDEEIALGITRRLSATTLRAIGPAGVSMVGDVTLAR